MNYVNDRFKDYISADETGREMIADMKKETDDFMESFSDSPERVSRWGHNFFCDDDGGRLIFDIHSPKAYKCEVCGKVYYSDKLERVWTYFYRNEAVVTALKAAVIYRATGERKYFNDSLKIMDFYSGHYSEFGLHNKEDETFDSLEKMSWGCGRMMPQGLNESIVAIRFVQTIEILRNDLTEEWLDRIYKNMFREMFRLLSPQVISIHNICCWNLSAIGVMGLCFHDTEMTDFAFRSPFNIREQLKKGVTPDFFWYEGSIHYNFFLLEGISYLFLFSRLYGYDFGDGSTEIYGSMLKQAYLYAFDNQYFPNPNDGWPNLNLKTFSYVYHTAARVFGEQSEIGNMTKLIEASDGPRSILPLSEPYYWKNRICLERLLFNIDFDYGTYSSVRRESYNFPKSNFAMLRNETWNVFLKYGLNGKSHAHPDIMTVELMYRNHRITRDLSNAGYGSRLCNEWHRKTISHNTVCLNGNDITSVSPGRSLAFDRNRISAEAENVYEGINYIRTVSIDGDSLSDLFRVEGNRDGIYDYFFHFESDFEFLCDYETESADPGFGRNGYQHIIETRRVKDCGRNPVLYAAAGGIKFRIRIDLKDDGLYLLKTMDNPVNKTRHTILIRHTGTNPEYHMEITRQ